MSFTHSEGLIWHYVGVPVAATFRQRATVQIIRTFIDQPSDLRVDQSKVDMLPQPAIFRCRKAVRIPDEAYMTHITSAIPTPTFIGGPSGLPVSDMIPP